MYLGIGRMMATALAENGAHKVYIIGRREEKLKELAAQFPGYLLHFPFLLCIIAIAGARCRFFMS